PAQRLERREPADHRIEVTAAGADRLRDAAAETVQETRDLLQPRARRADQPDRAATNTVGEADPDSVEDGGSALGAHHEEPGARTASTRSVMPAAWQSDGHRPDPARARLFASVAMRNSTALTPGSRRSASATCISLMEST